MGRLWLRVLGLAGIWQPMKRPRGQTRRLRPQMQLGCYILPDAGAVGNLCGSTWARGAVQQLRRTKLPFKVSPHPYPKLHGGVGIGTRMCHWMLEIPMTLGKIPYVYRAYVVEGAPANVPALMGTHDMRNLNV